MADNKADKPKDAGVAEVQRVVDEENKKGYRGVVADPTPNENYTVAGVTSDKPTPETDADHARKVRDHVAGVEDMNK